MLMLVVITMLAMSEINGYSYKKEGECYFEKYEAGTGEVVISPIPTIEAKVPFTILADMFGHVTSETTKRLGFAANGWMHFTNFQKGALEMLTKTAPVLAPCLGMLGVAFGMAQTELNSISATQIIAEVNKAIDQVVDATNRRFEMMQEYVDQSARNMLDEMMEDHYKGQFDTWAKCVRHTGDKSEVDDCQVTVARVVNGLKYRFVNQRKYEADDNDNVPLNTADIKFLEVQLPALFKWASFHLLVIGTLVKMYEGKSDQNSQINYAIYKSDLVMDGNYYLGYMEWAMRRIRRARIEDQPRSPSSWKCLGWDDDYYTWWWWTTGKFVKRISRKCSFKQSTMSPRYCDLTSTWNGDTRLCYGVFCNTASSFSTRHRWQGDSQRDEASKLYDNYQSSLTTNLDNFWEKEIKSMLPELRQTIQGLEDSPRRDKKGKGRGKAASKKDDTDGEGSADVPEEEKEMNRKFTEKQKGKEEEKKLLLAGTDETMSMVEYFQKVISNDTKKKKKKKKSKTGKKHE